MKAFDQQIFEKIISKIKRNTGMDLEQIGFDCKYNNYRTNFYGNLEEDYQLRVEDFGLMKESKWIQLEPTEIQLNIMQNIINDEIEQVEEEIKREEVNIDPDFNGSFYEYYGVH